MEQRPRNLNQQPRNALFAFLALLPLAVCWPQTSVSTHTKFVEFIEGGKKFVIPLEYRDTLKLSLRSPNKKVTATVIVRDAGATTDFSTFVNLRQEGEALDLDADTLLDPNRGPGDNPANIFVAKGKPKVSLRWNSATSLSVICGSPNSIFTKRPKWKNISISYPTK